MDFIAPVIKGEYLGKSKCSSKNVYTVAGSNNTQYPQGYGAKLLLAFTKKIFLETFLKIRIFQQSFLHFSGLNI